MGIILHQSRTKKKGFIRLSKMGICISKHTVNTKLKEMAKGHDLPVLTWKEKVQKIHDLHETTSMDTTTGNANDDDSCHVPLCCVKSKQYDIVGDNCDFEQRPTIYSSVKCDKGTF
ncbi:uncharacterized protein LOC114576374 [Exaiptasia diaphana]|uniref:Transposase n=1 Tax=Exaiptasia diaphana TaxID=2652724 RepID=A0A913YTB0_EXADI|nr:uncharacterized protein LOC114576374 [Exaiptasia diaphana]